MDWVLGIPEVTRNGKNFNTVLTVTDQEPTDYFISRMHSNWKATYHMMEELRETSCETANKHRHEHQIQVGDRVLISLRKHDAATLSARPRGHLAPHFAGHFVVLRQTARNAF